MFNTLSHHENANQSCCEMPSLKSEWLLFKKKKEISADRDTEKKKELLHTHC